MDATLNSTLVVNVCSGKKKPKTDMNALCSGYLQGLTPACVTLAMWKWELQRVSVQPLMKTNKWRRNTLTKPNRNTLINYATGCESLCPFKSHTAVVCPFMQLRGVWVGGWRWWRGCEESASSAPRSYLSVLSTVYGQEFSKLSPSFGSVSAN